MHEVVVGRIPTSVCRNPETGDLAGVARRGARGPSTAGRPSFSQMTGVRFNCPPAQLLVSPGRRKRLSAARFPASALS
jgi:hypothetical protein